MIESKNGCCGRREHNWTDGGKDHGRNGRSYVVCSDCGAKKYI